MRIAIYGRQTIQNASAELQQLFSKLIDNGCELIFFEPYYHFVKSKINFQATVKMFSSSEEIVGKADYFFSLGGDGTLLEALAYVRNSGMPVLGINTGRLGFLTGISKEEVELLVAALKQNKFVTEKRTLVMLESPAGIFQEVNYALNDITIHKNESSAMLVVHAYINDKFLNSYHADGLIIATPTGSTAYSLSCGGPIVLPDSENFIITPIAPHNLNLRPIVIPDNSTIKLKIESRLPRFTVTMDSRSAVCQNEQALVIKKADFVFNILKLENHDFLATLRSKLTWGLDKRN